MFLVKATRNRGRSCTWTCPLGAVLVAVICFTLMMFKPRPLEISSAGVSGGCDGLLP
jgi:hypothetical protein